MSSSALDVEEDVKMILVNQESILKKQEEGVTVICNNIEEELESKVCQKLSSTDEKIQQLKDMISVQLGQFQNTVKADLLQILSLRDIMADSIRSDEIVELIRVVLTCQICQRVPNQGNIVLALCCGQLIGCGDCTQKWLMENETCPLCRGICIDKVVPFRSLDNVFAKLK